MPYSSECRPTPVQCRAVRAAIPTLATALTTLFAVSAPTASRAEVLESLDGEARHVATPAAIATPGEPLGGFALTSAGRSATCATRPVSCCSSPIAVR